VLDAQLLHEFEVLGVLVVHVTTGQAASYVIFTDVTVTFSPVVLDAQLLHEFEVLGGT
jgi:hypothetical protein